MRILGLDLGDRTIGVALSDPFGWTAQGLEVIRRRPGRVEDDLQRLELICRQHGVEEIVLGLPRNMDGSYGPRAEGARDFAALLQERLGRPVRLQDERLTTVAAERALLEADLSRAKRRQVIDQQAAVLILQQYLDARARAARAQESRAQEADDEHR